MKNKNIKIKRKDMIELLKFKILTQKDKIK